MKQEINLLSTVSKKQRKMSPFFSVSLLVLLISVIIVVIALLYILFLKSTLSGLASQEKNALTTMSKFDKQKIELLTISERLSSIRRLVASKQAFGPRIGAIVNNLPKSMTVDTLDVQDNKVKMTVRASSLATFNTFFNDALLKLPQQQKEIKKIDILSFLITQNGYVSLINIVYDSPLFQ